MSNTCVEGLTWLPFFKNIFIEISLLTLFLYASIEKSISKGVIAEFKIKTGILYSTSLHDAIPVVSNSVSILFSWHKNLGRVIKRHSYLP